MVGRRIGRSGKELGMNTHGLGDGPLFKFWFGLMGIERYGDQIVLVLSILGALCSVFFLFVRKKSN
jgi:hypothetical protein